MNARAVPAPLAHLPNALTVLRLALIPIFVAVWLAADAAGGSWPAGLIFAAAGATDQLDGFLARRWHVESRFGKIADPLADRLMIDAAVILLVVDGRLPWPALAVVVGRDVALMGGYKLVVPRGYEFDVSFLGKLATWVLYASIAFVLVTAESTEWPVWLFWTGVALALAAGVGYLLKARREVRR